MTLRRKTLVIIGATLFGLLVAFFFLTRFTLLRRFADYENQQTRQQVERASTALDNEITQLGTIARDNAVWDSAYDFIQHPNPRFLKSNFPLPLFAELRLDVAVFLNSKHQIVFKRYTRQGVESVFPSKIEAALLRPDLINLIQRSNYKISGLVVLPDGPMMIASSPILKSSGEGPAQGTLILGRRLNANEVDRLSLLTRLDLEMHEASDPDLSRDFHIARGNLSRLQPVVVQPVDSSTIAGYSLLYGIDGEPALVLGVRLPRRIHAEAKTTELYLLGSALGVGLVFGLVTLFLLEKLVLSRLIGLGKDVAEIGARGDLSARVKSEGGDELSQLSEMINRMLADLERVEDERRQDQERYRAYITHSTEGIWRCELREPLSVRLPEEQQIEHLERYLYFAECNDALARLHAFKSGMEMQGMALRELFDVSQPKNLILVRKFLRSGYLALDGESVELGADGQTRYFLNSISGVVDNGSLVRIWGSQREITEQRRLEAQLRQAQKMEAIGRLAGGVAHDFNNLLSVIHGYTEILLRRFQPRDPAYREAKQVLTATERAAALTQQLLAFGRKQVLVPRVIDLNTVVKDMDHMLRRLIREDIDLDIRTDSHLWLVRADPAQMEQVIINLAVNASDAMPTGGRVILETRNVELDATTSRQDPALVPGSYVLLSVSDTGIGMDAETRARIFEPFFSTKELTKGTGLGLATVYGIVQQSGGYISVYSEPGHGSIFRVYLPRAEGKVEPSLKEADIEAPPKGSGTVLLVEDDAAVRGLAREVLQEQGYTVLVAGSGEEALRAVETHAGEIDLLMTDVIMPGMAGDELVEHLRLRLPELKVVFVSGYASESIPRIVTDGHTAFLQKPFPVEDLVRKVYEMTAGR
ncbi:MAG TPA: CHASE4 domain-containing protein [Terriglobales bacterium]|nr:CHASE4 domain-containing protein [Terriglobales bacterium]